MNRSEYNKKYYEKNKDTLLEKAQRRYTKKKDAKNRYSCPKCGKNIYITNKAIHETSKYHNRVTKYEFEPWQETFEDLALSFGKK